MLICTGSVRERLALGIRNGVLSGGMLVGISLNICGFPGTYIVEFQVKY